MRYTSLLIVLATAQAAHAHPGHLAEVAGHGHWLGAAALGAAIAIGLVIGLKGRKSDAESEEAELEDETAEPKEA